MPMLNPTQEEMKDTLLFASALALARLGHAMHVKGVNAPYGALDAYLRGLLEENKDVLNDAGAEQTYFEYVCVQIASYEEDTQDPETIEQIANTVISQIMNVAFAHVLKIENLNVGVMPNPEDLSIPNSWLEN